MPVPAGVSLTDAAALPEVACTVWSNVFMIAGLQRGEWFLVHGGAGGIGTMAIQLAAALGARVMTTGGSAEKLAQCAELGAEVTIDYKQQDFVAEVKGATDGHGADVILDNMGASYLGRNVDALATEGRLVVIGMQGGTKGELDLGMLLRKRGAVIATALRSRPVEEKAAICAAVVEHVWPLVADGTIRPVVGARFALADAAAGARADGVGRRQREDPPDRVLTCSPLGWGHERRSSLSRPRRPGTRRPSHVVIVGPDGQQVAVPTSALQPPARGTTTRSPTSPAWSSSPPR